MNTPTEAHLDLALQITEALARSGNVAAAQLIADSEARAIAKQVEALAILTLRWDKVEKERDHGALERAMKAEAEAHKWKASHDNQVKLKSIIMSRADLGDRAPRVVAMMAEVDAANARAEKAEAELATERARLDSGQIMLIVAGERVWHCGVDLRAAIDAAIWRAEARSSIRHFLNTTQ